MEVTVGHGREFLFDVRLVGAMSVCEVGVTERRHDIRRQWRASLEAPPSKIRAMSSPSSVACAREVPGATTASTSGPIRG